ncbi:receptor-type tyrosine-protein phosphatase mu-like isoform X2 [Ostrea edulis]|nr:receptor-type tyrosine-protein phosphatase mu-like isoform X2 [Ostrea edulis]
MRRRNNATEKSRTEEEFQNLPKNARKTRKRKCDYSQEVHYQNRDDISNCVNEVSVTEEHQSEGGYYNITPKDTCMKIENLHRLITEKANNKENNMFIAEFQELPSANTDICTSAQKEENVTKNRFKTTFPYEHSRIILKESWNESDNDYINANYIKDVKDEERYIASQGPRKNTTADFWRMIWQENIGTIVMLTNIVEGGKHKCSRYWPEEEGTVFEVGPCTVRLTKETVYAAYIIRSLLVHREDTSDKRAITQFHYTAWPDHGTPEEAGLIQFHRAVNKIYRPGNPLLVHCSAGVGRTGTYIGLDSLLRHGTEQGKIDVFNFVKRMRGDRMTMVQTRDQYVFLHKALLHGFQTRDTLLALNDFSRKARDLIDDISRQNQSTLYQEFKRLCMLRPTYDEDDKCDARKTENLKKNAIVEILPVSKYRPYLMTIVEGRNDYINAVFIPSFTNKTGFIITQTPLPDTEVDLWTMCLDHDVDAVVMLIEEAAEDTWLPRRGSPKMCSPYRISCEKTGSTTDLVTQDTMLISSEDQQKPLEIIKLPSNDASAFSTAIDLLQEKTRTSQFTTVVVSRNGAGPAGIFCAVYNALEQLRRDEEVDMFTIVRQIHTRRPEAIDKLDEYTRCFEIVLNAVTTENIYVNL